MDYLSVDLETGEKRHTDAAPDLSRGICRTKELRLRRIPKGTFTMGTLVEIREENGEGASRKGSRKEVRRFRRGAYSKPTRGDCKPGRRNFPEKN